LEVMSMKQLRAMVHRLYRNCPTEGNEFLSKSCAYREAQFPESRAVIPRSWVDSLLQELSPHLHTPKLQTPSSGHSGRVDGLVLISNLPHPTKICWAWLVEDPEPEMLLEDGECKEVTVLPAAQGGQLASTILQAHAGQLFFVLSPDSSKRSLSFTYSGELELAAVTAGPAERLEVESMDEDELKIFIGSVGISCVDAASDEAFYRCLNARSILPKSKLLLPAPRPQEWFLQLWQSKEHWKLCAAQPDSPTVRNVSIAAGSHHRGLMGRVLREDPLVMVVPGLSSAEECEALIAYGGYDMGRATVSGGGHSRDRRTLARNLFPDFEPPEKERDILTQLTARFFEVAQQATGFSLNHEGQEPVNWLYYKPGFEYRPHCDGGCGAQKVQRGKRVATSLLYCKVADVGGGTVFPPAKLKLTPKAGDLLLFTYESDPHSVTMHAACPVLKGSKLTATQWYREGLTREKTWEHHNDL